MSVNKSYHSETGRPCIAGHPFQRSVKINDFEPFIKKRLYYSREKLRSYRKSLVGREIIQGLPTNVVHHENHANSSRQRSYHSVRPRDLKRTECGSR
jgi:hypothetical protein